MLWLQVIWPFIYPFEGALGELRTSSGTQPLALKITQALPPRIPSGQKGHVPQPEIFFSSGFQFLRGNAIFISLNNVHLKQRDQRDNYHIMSLSLSRALFFCTKDIAKVMTAHCLFVTSNILCHYTAVNFTIRIVKCKPTTFCGS